MQRQTNTKTKSESSTSFPLSRGILQRKCACGNQSAGGGECAECGKKNQFLQRRAIHVSEPGDRYEQEADRIADLVMRMPEPTAKHQVESEKEGILQRKAIANSITPLQASSTGQNQSSEVPPIVDEVLRSPGQPLDTDTRTFMESRFGYDFSQIQIHTDAKAAESAKAINALAYTVGRDIVFRTGIYSPKDPVLAHELAHTIQQGGSTPTNILQRQEDSLKQTEEAPRNPNCDQTVSLPISGSSTGSFPFGNVYSPSFGKGGITSVTIDVLADYDSSPGPGIAGSEDYRVTLFQCRSLLSNVEVATHVNNIGSRIRFSASLPSGGIFAKEVYYLQFRNGSHNANITATFSVI